ncbi:MAG: glycosyltransferase family 2 protein, partial [Proteobacteria bacterium]|nr:glycosyltransferase family 2 protein [Pseudomonadota bacterium]
YNGGHYLGESLECLRTQTYRDFQVNIFDNASTDETNDIASGFAERDARFKVIRRLETIPMGDNFTKAAEDSDCDYFAWRADDDLSAPDFVEHLVEALDSSPQADLAVCNIRTEKVYRNKTNIHPVFELPNGRLRQTIALMFGSHASWIYCMFRRDKIATRYKAAIDALPHVWATDHATLFPFFLDRAVAITCRTEFIQRIGGDPSRSPYSPADSALEWEIYGAFYRFCADHVDRSDFNPMERRLLKVALVRYASKRTFRFQKMLWHKLSGH